MEKKLYTGEIIDEKGILSPQDFLDSTYRVSYIEIRYYRQQKNGRIHIFLVEDIYLYSRKFNDFLIFEAFETINSLIFLNFCCHIENVVFLEAGHIQCKTIWKIVRGNSKCKHMSEFFLYNVFKY